MSTLPCYIIGNSVPSMKDGLLFHYTDSKGLFGILESMSLRPSKIQNLNDLNEANLHNYYTRDIFKRKAAKEYIFNHCSIICFTQNYEYDGYCFYGHNRPSQWAYYSNNNNGACIVLDEKALINANKDKLLNNFTIDDVEYKIDNAHKEMLEEDENVEQFVKKNEHDLFFVKHIDWKNENERRILLYNIDKPLNIDGSIVYIALGEKFWKNDDNLKHLFKIVSDENSLCFHKLGFYSFILISYGKAGYSEMDGTLHFEILLSKWMQESQQYYDYYKWICKEYCMKMIDFSDAMNHNLSIPNWLK